MLPTVQRDHNAESFTASLGLAPASRPSSGSRPTPPVTTAVLPENRILVLPSAGGWPRRPDYVFIACSNYEASPGQG